MSYKTIGLAGTTLPGNLGANREAEIVERIGDDYVVVEADQQIQHDLSITKTFLIEDTFVHLNVH